MCKGNEHQKSKVSNPDQALVWQTPLSTRNDSLNIHMRDLSPNASKGNVVRVL